MCHQTFIRISKLVSQPFVILSLVGQLNLVKNSGMLDPKSNPIVREYILPDLSRNRKGRIRQPDDIVTENDQILVMNNERFCVPEVLFRPDDIGETSFVVYSRRVLCHYRATHDLPAGLEQMGVAHTVALCISLLPVDLRGMFWANIGLMGGNTKFSGFRSRLLVGVSRVAEGSLLFSTTDLASLQTGRIAVPCSG